MKKIPSWLLNKLPADQRKGCSPQVGTKPLPQGEPFLITCWSKRFLPSLSIRLHQLALNECAVTTRHGQVTCDTTRSLTPPDTGQGTCDTTRSLLSLTNRMDRRTQQEPANSQGDSSATAYLSHLSKVPRLELWLHSTPMALIPRPPLLTWQPKLTRRNRETCNFHRCRLYEHHRQTVYGVSLIENRYSFPPSLLLARVFLDSLSKRRGNQKAFHLGAQTLQPT